jgi:hypothetical protein
LRGRIHAGPLIFQNCGMRGATLAQPPHATNCASRHQVCSVGRSARSKNAGCREPPCRLPIANPHGSVSRRSSSFPRRACARGLRSAFSLLPLKRGAERRKTQGFANPLGEHACRRVRGPCRDPSPFGAPPRRFRGALPHTPRVHACYSGLLFAFTRQSSSVLCSRVILPVKRIPRRPESPAGQPNPQAPSLLLINRGQPADAPQTSRTGEQIKNILQVSTPQFRIATGRPCKPDQLF